MASKKDFKRLEIVLHGVASYPSLDKPKKFEDNDQGTYCMDVLFDKDDPQMGVLKKKIHKVRVLNWGEDKTEWPKKARRALIHDGDERQDQPTYAGKFYIRIGSRSPVEVIHPNGKPFNPSDVKGGMFVFVAVSISPWLFQKFEGLNLYLSAVKVDTSQKRLEGFGGKKSAAKLFGVEEAEDEEVDDEDEAEDVVEDEDDMPVIKKKKALQKKKPAYSDDDEDESKEEDEEE